MPVLWGDLMQVRKLGESGYTVAGAVWTKEQLQDYLQIYDLEL